MKSVRCFRGERGRLVLAMAPLYALEKKERERKLEERLKRNEKNHGLK